MQARSRRILLAVCAVALVGLAAPRAAADKAPAGLPSFWNNVGWALTLALVPPLSVSLGTWLSDIDDMPTSPRGMFRGAIGAADRRQAGNQKQPTMYLGLRTGSFYGESNKYGLEVNTEVFTWGVDKKIDTREIDYRMEALMAFSLWRNFDFPKISPGGEEAQIPSGGTAGLTLLAGLGYVSEPGNDDRNAIPGIPVALRFFYMPHNVFGGEVEVEALVPFEKKLYMVTDITLFLNYGNVQLPITGGVQYRLVTDGEDLLHLIGVAIGGF